MEFYLRSRPRYPGKLLEFCRGELGLGAEDQVADIGSGTGFLSELFLDGGNTVFGVEPNREMREAADWKPLFLKPEQDKTLAALSEVVVPGSTSAKVNQFIDLLLSVDNGEHQREFVASLAAVEDEARKRFGRGFAALAQSEMETLLTDFSKGAHGEAFQNLKEWIAGAYYSSEQGMRELGWNGNYAFESFPGCEHGEH